MDNLQYFKNNPLLFLELKLFALQNSKVEYNKPNKINMIKKGKIILFLSQQTNITNY